MRFDLIHNQIEALPLTQAYTYLSGVYENTLKTLPIETQAAYENYQRERRSETNDGVPDPARLQLVLSELKLLLANPDTELTIHPLEEDDIKSVGEVAVNQFLETKAEESDVEFINLTSQSIRYRLSPQAWAKEMVDVGKTYVI